MKLSGNAKRAFLAKMAAGRARAAGRRPRNPRVSQKQVRDAAAEYQTQTRLYGERSLSTERAHQRWFELQRQLDAQRGARVARARNPNGYARELAEEHMRHKIGPSFGHRRKPRVRGARTCKRVATLDTRRTRRAAFRSAREMRDRFAEKRPLKVCPPRPIKGRKTAAHDVARSLPRRRKNPELMTITNPSRAELARAVEAYRQFHGVEPERATKLGRSGKVLIALGELREIVYQPRRGTRRGPAFFHKFRAGNVLAVTADGKQLAIVDRRKRRAVDFDLGIVS